jgi:hypothetical protein
MSRYECTVDRFLEDVKDHELTIIHDEGLNRHIRMKRPQSSSYYYDIITWNGYLTICGDMGTYVFRRIEDMFQFFQMDDNDFNKSKTEPLSINPGYWGEKLEAFPKRGYKEYSQDKFMENVKDYLDHHFPDDLDIEIDDDLFETDEAHAAEYDRILGLVKARVWEEVRDDLRYIDDNEYAYYAAIRDFDFAEIVDIEDYEIEVKFNFDDFWEYSSEVYTFHYIWCLYAIVHAINKYKEAKA